MPYRTRCIGSALVVLAVVTGGCGSRRGYSAETDRQVLVNEIRVAETLVVGLVFTQLMRDNDIVTATQALCVIESRLGFDGAIEEATVMLRSLDWDAPANRSMLGRMLRLGSTSICEEADTAADTPLTAVLPTRPQLDTGATAADVDAAIAAFLDTAEGALFVTTIRGLEADHPEVFTAAMTDDELVRLESGICSTIGSSDQVSTKNFASIRRRAGGRAKPTASCSH